MKTQHRQIDKILISKVKRNTEKYPKIVIIKKSELSDSKLVLFEEFFKSPKSHNSKLQFDPI